MHRDRNICKRVNQALETLFLALTGLYLIYQVSQVTTFGLTWPKGYSNGLMWGLASVALLRALALKPQWPQMVVAVGIATVYALVYRSDGYAFLLFLLIFTVGFMDIDYRKILKMYLATVGVFYCVTVFAGMLGIITNYVRVKDGLRSAWGISYPTDFASMGLYILMMLWIVWDRLPGWFALFLCVVYLLLARFIARSSTSALCGALLFAAMLYCMFERRVLDRCRKPCWMKKGLNLLSMAAFPLLGLTMFALMAVYARDTDLGHRLNALLSDRLKYAVDAWRLHGLKAFGTPFKQVGGGFSVFRPVDYNFVDSSYPLILLRYGWVLFFTLCFSWDRTAYKAVHSGNRRLVLVMIIIAIHAFSEHHFLDSHFNVLVTMPLAAYNPQHDNAQAKVSAKKRFPRLAARAARMAVVIDVLTAALFFTVVFFIAPAALSWLKTVLEYHMMSREVSAPIQILVLLGVLGWLCSAVWATRETLRAFILGSHMHLILPIALLMLGLVGIGSWLYADSTIEAAAEICGPMVEADRRALEIATQAANGKVYCGVLPAAYKRSVKGLSYAAFFEDDLARLRGDTVLMPADTEHGSFFESGCLYVQISEEHALYTGDRAVAEAMTAAGYHLTGFYSSATEVDLADAAKRNQLTYDKSTGLRLDKVKRPMKKGPYYNLYSGRYTATWELRLPEGIKRTEDVLCTLSVTTNKHSQTLLEKAVHGVDFDEEGRLDVTVTFEVEDVRNVAFCTRIEKKKKLDILSVRFARSPERDVHTFFDNKLRMVRQEYYNLEGSPAPQPGGYFSYEMEYDRYGNVSVRRYYDAYGQLSLRTDGFAETRLFYNAKRQIVREEFYGVNGEPVMISGRYAANEREYDQDGNIIVWRYYDVNGQLSVITEGWAEIHRRFNGDRKVVWEEYFGADGAPMLQASGYSAVEQDYDEAGNMMAQRFFDANKPVLRTDGYAEVRWEYNGLHQVIRESYFGTSGQPIVIFDGYASCEREYDDQGNNSVVRYFDAAGQPVLMRSGYAMVCNEYDDRRNVVRQSYYGRDGLPKLLSAGFAAWERTYNEFGTPATEKYFGEAGEPVLNGDGYFEVRREFNAHGRVVTERYYGTEGEPIACARGYACALHTYDDGNLVKEDSFFAPDGSPATIGVGYVRITYDYDENRQLLLTHYLDGDGNTVQAGSGYLHEFLLALSERDVTLFISAKDEATNALTPALVEDLRALGSEIDLRGRYRNSYYAVITPEETVEEVAAQEILTREGTVDGLPYSITSAGFQVGNYSSIMIGGIEYSKNVRGLNVVVYDNASHTVADAVAFDTYVQDMTVTR